MKARFEALHLPTTMCTCARVMRHASASFNGQSFWLRKHYVHLQLAGAPARPGHLELTQAPLGSRSAQRSTLHGTGRCCRWPCQPSSRAPRGSALSPHGCAFCLKLYTCVLHILEYPLYRRVIVHVSYYTKGTATCSARLGLCTPCAALTLPQ